MGEGVAHEESKAGAGEAAPQPGGTISMSRKRWLPQKGQTLGGAVSEPSAASGWASLSEALPLGVGAESNARARAIRVWRWPLANRP